MIDKMIILLQYTITNQPLGSEQAIGRTLFSSMSASGTPDIRVSRERKGEREREGGERGGVVEE